MPCRLTRAGVALLMPVVVWGAVRIGRAATQTILGKRLIIKALVAVAAVLAATSAFAFVRTERRQSCASSASLRQPFFGDLHVHTRLSFDAFPWNPPLGPRDAYLFALGNEVEIPPRDAAGNRLHAKLARPLDFTAVTDHAEGFGETGVCMDPKSPGYLSPECILYRGDAQPAVSPEDAYLLFGAWFYGDPLPTAQTPMPVCFLPGVDCQGADADLWQSIRDAAEEFYDRTSACNFTTLVGYEWTGTPLGANLHRNVIFRNDRVPAHPISKTDTGPDPAELWNRLGRECLERDGGSLTEDSGCDVLVIPHNPNLSAGQQFLDPASPENATLRAKFEPLVEIMQAKGTSECRTGLGTADELCDFELLSNGTFFPFPRPEAAFGPEFTERSFVRNVLKAGLALGRPQSLGVNPFRLGFVGATDSHFGTPGNTEEASFQGSHPSTASPDQLLGEIENNPGGLTVAWAEENSRDSIFEALRRRETYATSGTRPIVRFFGGWDYPKNLCKSDRFVEEGYAGGVPMGGFLAEPRQPGAPRFAVSVLKDPAGSDLQAVQIVKGWVDASGATHEAIYDVAGSRDDGASVEPSTCAPTGSGATSLCALWTDPSFDAGEPAFWYVRVLENPTCRWSTRYCQAHGVNPFDANCADEASAAGSQYSACCDTDTVVRPVIQERAWTSPIWWR